MQNEIISGIYCIENTVTNKKYIGQSKNIYDRWRRHKGELNHGNHDNDYLQKAWNKYGEDSFSFYILDTCEINELDQREIYYIELYNTLDRDCGYNLKSGGQFIKNTLSKESRKKLSNSIKESYCHSNLKEVRRIDALNQWTNPEIKEKIIGKNNGMYGRHHTEESKKKMSEHSKGIRSFRRNTTPVFCLELNKQFNDATEASKDLSLDSSGILKVCRGERKTCGGYHWKFLNIGE
jgi:group I intron endonuclease